MKRKPMEQKIRHAFLSLPHDGLSDDVFDACRPSESAPPSRRPIRLMPMMMVVAASLALLVCGVAMLWAHRPSGYMTVSLDVNPSIAIDVDDRETIVSVTALNEDAAAVIGDQVYTGQTVAKTVQELVAAMVQQGYLSEVANSVLISVDSTDADKAARLQTKLSGEVEQALAADGLSGAVISQTLHTDKELAVLATQYGISTGKATLISHLIELDPLKSFAELAGASINELNLLAQKLEATVQATGTASEKAYVSRDKAIAIAAADAAADVRLLTIVETEFDFERGRMCYEVEFVLDGIEYEYDLDATTGEILKAKQEAADDTDYDAGEFKNFAAIDPVDATQVKADVLAHAGLTEQDITEYDIEWDTRRNLFVYEIEFESGNVEYKYHVNAETGEILDDRAETDNEDDIDEVPMNTDGRLSPETVRETVRSHAGCQEAEMINYECEADTEDGKAVYEIEFEYNGVEYEYTVDAISGEILRSKTDKD